MPRCKAPEIVRNEAYLDVRGKGGRIMGRGIEGTRIFRTDRDREDFLKKLADLSMAGKCVQRDVRAERA
jgi:hypothetical protein